MTMLLFRDVSDVTASWEQHWKSFSDDIELRQRRGSEKQNFVIDDSQLECLVLYDVDLQLRKRGKTLEEIPTLLELDERFHRQSQNTLLYEENMYDRRALGIEVEKCRIMLNEQQSCLRNCCC